MRAVLAAAVDFFQRLNLVELVVAVGVDHPVKAAAVPGDPAAVHHDIQAVERPQQPLRVPDWHVDFLDVNLRGVVADLRRRDAVKVAVLVGGDQAALVILGQRDPRALFALGHDVQQLRLEAVGQAKLLRGGDTRRAAAAFGSPWRTRCPKERHPTRPPPGSCSSRSASKPSVSHPDLRAARAPRVVGIDDLVARGAGGDVELAHQAGDAALVPAAHGDDIAADVEIFFNVRSAGVVPVASGQHLFAVDEGLEAVVAGQGQLGRLGRLVEADHLAEINRLVVLRRTGTPNPTGFLRRSGAGGCRDKKRGHDGQTSACSFR